MLFKNDFFPNIERISSFQKDSVILQGCKLRPDRRHWNPRHDIRERERGRKRWNSIWNIGCKRSTKERKRPNWVEIWIARRVHKFDWVSKFCRSGLHEIHAAVSGRHPHRLAEIGSPVLHGWSILLGLEIINMFHKNLSYDAFLFTSILRNFLHLKAENYKDLKQILQCFYYSFTNLMDIFHEYFK